MFSTPPRPAVLRLTLLAVLALTASPVAAQTAPLAERVARLDSALTALHADGLFDGALAVSDADGAVVYRFAAGDTGGAALTPATPLYLASVSKAMTAAAALSLAADGRLDLDAPVGRYLAPWPYPTVTVRMLMDQTAGLHWLTMLNAHADTTGQVTTADLLALVEEYRPGTVHEPGTAFDYDNANFAALAAVVEAAAERPYADVLRERVFRPAGMATARTGPSDELAWAGWAGGNGDAVHASALDLLAFDDAFWSGWIVPDALVTEARRPPVLAGGDTSRYAAGRFLVDAPRPLVGHWGEGGQTTSGLWRERETGTTYAILASDHGVYRTPTLTAAMAIWNGEPFTLPIARPVADVPEEVLARHVGVYESGFGRLHITLEGGQLHLEPEGAGGSEPLVPASETVFYFCCQDLTWEFVVDGAGRTTGIQIQGTPETLGQRVE